MEQQKNLVGGILIGAAIGVTAGLLLAPESGKKVREMVGRKSANIKSTLLDKVTESIDELKSHFTDTLNQAVGKAAVVASAAKEQISEKTKTL